MLAAYSVAIAAIFPQFISDVMPLVLAVYVPAKLPFSRMLVQYATPLWLAAWTLIALLKRREIFAPPLCLLLAASLGFAVAFYIQQKGWPYQSYPMLGLALIGFVPIFLERGGARCPPSAAIGRNEWPSHWRPACSLAARIPG